MLDNIELMYQDWMHAKWYGLQSKQDTIRMIELGYNWSGFKEELLQLLESLDNE